MKLLLEFIQDFSFEDQHYWSLINPEEKKVEVFWINRNHKSIWRVIIQEEISEFTDAEPLLSFLENIGVKENQFKEQVTQNILTMVCFANNITSQATALLGEDVVTSAIEAHQDFASDLLNLISEQMKKNVKKPKLKIIKKEP